MPKGSGARRKPQKKGQNTKKTRRKRKQKKKEKPMGKRRREELREQTLLSIGAQAALHGGLTFPTSPSASLSQLTSQTQPQQQQHQQGDVQMGEVVAENSTFSALPASASQPIRGSDPLVSLPVPVTDSSIGTPSGIYSFGGAPSSPGSPPARREPVVYGAGPFSPVSRRSEKGAVSAIGALGGGSSDAVSSSSSSSDPFARFWALARTFEGVGQSGSVSSSQSSSSSSSTTAAAAGSSDATGSTAAALLEKSRLLSDRMQALLQRPADSSQNVGVSFVGAADRPAAAAADGDAEMSSVSALLEKSRSLSNRMQALLPQKMPSLATPPAAKSTEAKGTVTRRDRAGDSWTPAAVPPPKKKLPTRATPAPTSLTGPSAKKRRHVPELMFGGRNQLLWTEELHQAFVDAYDKLGTKTTASQVLREMNVPGLNARHVSSHMQHYRKQLERDSPSLGKRRKLVTQSADFPSDLDAGVITSALVSGPLPQQSPVLRCGNQKAHLREDGNVFFQGHVASVFDFARSGSTGGWKDVFWVSDAGWRVPLELIVRRYLYDGHLAREGQWCVCKGIDDPNMVACDFCLGWYHPEVCSPARFNGLELWFR
jgi:SHAQKYF class myb-like DNA-binding protein